MATCLGLSLQRNQRPEGYILLQHLIERERQTAEERRKKDIDYMTV